MVTPVISMGAYSKVAVFAAFRKLTNALAVYAELSPNFASNPGSFLVVSSPASAATYGWRSAGSIMASINSPALYNAPHSAVLTCLGDITNDRASIAVNATLPASVATVDQGVGNFRDYALSFYRRDIDPYPLACHDHGCALSASATALPDAAFIAAVEAMLARHIGVTLP